MLERPPGPLRLDELEFGTMNNLGDTTAVGSGSRRRGTSKTFINASLRNAYSRDSLRGTKSFYGIVIGYRQTDHPAYSKKETLLISPDQAEPRVQRAFFVYKVFIPELEPRPYPKTLCDPVIKTYPDVHVAHHLQGSPLVAGSVVRVSYSNDATMSDPLIVEKEGSIFFGFEGVDTAKLKSLWSKQPTSIIGQGGIEPFEDDTPNADRIRGALGRVPSFVSINPGFLGFVTEKENGAFPGYYELSSGGDISAELASAALSVLNTLQIELPKVNGGDKVQIRISAGNDLYHQGLVCAEGELPRAGYSKGGEIGCYTSHHTSGNALDFTVSDTSTRVLDKVVEVLRRHAAGSKSFNFLDEYRDPTRHATGRHFHISWGVDDGARAAAERRIAELLTTDDGVKTRLDAGHTKEVKIVPITI